MAHSTTAAAVTYGAVGAMGSPFILRLLEPWDFVISGTSLDKPPEFWLLAVFVSMGLFLRSPHLRLLKRTFNSAMAIVFAIVFSGRLANVLPLDDIWAALLILMAANPAFDIAVSSFGDRDFWVKEIKQVALDWIRKRVGVKRYDGDDK